MLVVNVRESSIHGAYGISIIHIHSIYHMYIQYTQIHIWYIYIYIGIVWLRALWFLVHSTAVEHERY